MNWTGEYLNFVFFFPKPDPGVGVMLIQSVIPVFGDVAELLGMAKGSAYAHNYTAKHAPAFESYDLPRLELRRESLRGRFAALPPEIRTVGIQINSRGSEDQSVEYIAKIELDFSDCYVTSDVVLDNLGNKFDKLKSDGVCVISIEIGRLAEVSRDQRVHLMNTIVRDVASATRAYSGFINCERIEDTGAANLYIATLDGPYAMKSIVKDTAWWSPSISKPLTAYGVHWGNYWGPELTAELDRHGVLAELDGWRVKDSNGQFIRRDASLSRLPGGGSFFALSGDPLHSSETWREFGGKFVGYVDSYRSDRLALAAWLFLRMRALRLVL